MRRRLCALSLLLCIVLTACSGSLPPNSPASGPDSSYTNGVSKKDEISTKIDHMCPLSYTTGSGTHIINNNGSYWDTTYHYELRINLTVKNTGDVISSIDNSMFTAYWDNSELLASSISYNNINTDSIKLAPGEQASVYFIYILTESQYNNWSIPGHSAIFKIQYGKGNITYTYSTKTNQITVNQ